MPASDKVGDHLIVEHLIFLQFDVIIGLQYYCNEELKHDQTYQYEVAEEKKDACVVLPTPHSIESIIHILVI